MIPGLTLAGLIKKASPGIHINIGGSVFTRLVNEISKNKELFSVFDSVIVHEGETALLTLISHLEDKFDIKDIPNPALMVFHWTSTCHPNLLFRYFHHADATGTAALFVTMVMAIPENSDLGMLTFFLKISRP